MSVLATDDMLHVMEWHNGEKEFSPFSDSEMARRQDELRTWMGKNNVDAALFTSYHCINYYSGWLYCYFGRKYGMVITQRSEEHTSELQSLMRISYAVFCVKNKNNKSLIAQQHYT